MCLSNTSNLKWYSGWWWAGWAWVVLVWYLSLTPHPMKVDVGVTYSDKIGHAIAYTWLMFWFGNLYHNLSVRLMFGIFFIFMGVGLELLQSLTPTRDYELGDILANTVGVFIGFGLVAGKGRFFLRFLEQRFVKSI